MEKRFINLTNHDISLLKENGEKVTIKPSGQIARTQYYPVKIDEINGVPIYKIEYSNTVGLPESEPGTYYLVSATVKNAVGLERFDVVAPFGVTRAGGIPQFARGARING